MSMHGALVRGVVLLLLSGWMGGGQWARAFNQSGHMDSVSLIVRQSMGTIKTLNEPERLVVMACAQLPDMSQELDATKVYGEAFLANKWDWIWWGIHDEMGNDKIRQMFVVQQLLHGLTGGEPKALRAAALKIVGQLADQVAASQGSVRIQALCALGLGLHLWGDALAHAEVPWVNEDESTLKAHPPRMYATGRGHGFEGHLPDDVLCSFYTKSIEQAGIASCHQDWDGDQYHRRFYLWLGYVTGSSGLIAGSNRLGYYFDAAPPFNPYDEAVFKRLTQAVRKISADAHDYPNHHLEDLLPDKNDPKVGAAIRSVLIPDLALPSRGQPASGADIWISGEFDALLKRIGQLDLFDPEPSCREVLNSILQIPGVPEMYKGQVAPTCTLIWQMYAGVAIRQFAGSIVARDQAHGRDKKSMDYLVHPDWLDQYGSPAGSPVSDYAKLVAYRLGQAH